MRHYIFLTTGGSTKDDAGNEAENCQQISDVIKAESALDAYNKALEAKAIYGCFDICFCYELADEGKVQGTFDLINDEDESED